MPRPQALLPILKIGAYTLIDQVRQKSFVVMFLIGAAFVFFSRSCYHGNYMVNGQMLDAGTVGGAVSKMSFHIIAAVALFIAALLAMRAFRQDRDNGMQACILSKPVTRPQYVMGKVLGLWVLALALMFILHAIVFIIISWHARMLMPAYLAASLLCAFNLLFVIICVLLFALIMSDFVAFISVMGITVISYVADGIHAIHQSQMAQMIMLQSGGAGSQTDVTWQKIVYELWPKLSGLQISSASLIGNTGSCTWGAFYPFINILLYCLILAAVLLWRFRDEDIQ